MMFSKRTYAHRTRTLPNRRFIYFNSYLLRERSNPVCMCSQFTKFSFHPFFDTLAQNVYAITCCFTDVFRIYCRRCQIPTRRVVYRVRNEYCHRKPENCSIVPHFVDGIVDTSIKCLLVVSVYDIRFVNERTNAICLVSLNRILNDWNKVKRMLYWVFHLLSPTAFLIESFGNV